MWPDYYNKTKTLFKNVNNHWFNSQINMYKKYKKETKHLHAFLNMYDSV